MFFCEDVDIFVRERITREELLARECTMFYPPQIWVFCHHSQWYPPDWWQD